MRRFCTICLERIVGLLVFWAAANGLLLKPCRDPVI
jgi:hypothetical protein